MATKMKIIDNEPSLLKMSASSIKSYSDCQKKYYFNYIERAPKKAWGHFVIGNLAHRALEIFHKIYAKGTKKELSKIMSYSFKKAREEYSEASDEIVKEVKGMLVDYLKRVYKIGMPNMLGAEIDFSFNLTDNILIRGYIDRVDIEGDLYHILDYKTSKNPKYLDEFQLLLYGIWLQREYPEVDRFKASYSLLRLGSKLQSYDFNRADVEKCKQKIIDYAGKINTSIEAGEWKTNPTKLCNWCDFQKICPSQSW